MVKVNNDLNNTVEEGFEEALGKLELIIRKLDEGNQRLDETLALYEEGIRLYRYCNKKIEAAEQKISVIQGESEIPFSNLLSALEE